MGQKQVEAITIGDAVYTGCGAAQHDRKPMLRSVSDVLLALMDLQRLLSHLV